MPTHALRLKDPTVGITVRFLEELTADYRGRGFSVRLWDGTEWCHANRPHFTLVLKHPGVLRNMFMSPSELTLGEAFIHGDFDVEGNLEGGFEMADFLLTREYSVIEKLKLGGWLARLPAEW
jgi:cyclopropane-fatty-acyl-phospholipid synthase